MSNIILPKFELLRNEWFNRDNPNVKISKAEFLAKLNLAVNLKYGSINGRLRAIERLKAVRNAPKGFKVLT